MAARCTECGADWSAGQYGRECAMCGGGALERSCPWCGGRCGAVWRRAEVDSADAGEAHWIGHCQLLHRRAGGAADLDKLEGADWWLDESALPDLIWAALLDVGPHAIVIDADGRSRVFPSRDLARRWLREDEYGRLDDLRDAGDVDADVRPPRAT